MADDLSGKAMAVMLVGRVLHAASPAGLQLAGQPAPVTERMPRLRPDLLVARRVHCWRADERHRCAHYAIPTSVTISPKRLSVGGTANGWVGWISDRTLLGTPRPALWLKAGFGCV